MNDSASPLFEPLELPCGATLRNRIAKAAMEENLADHGQVPGDRLRRLYRTWSEGGAGLILSGNVMVDPTALTGPGGVVLDAQQPLEPFRRWASAAHVNGGQVWLQINHPGRQTYASMGQDAVAPSAIQVDVGRHSKMFPVPRALEVDEIAGLVERFAVSAARAEEAGFDGVQIHAAHGYLISQFLSPLTNRRHDRWGGSLENRARLLLDVVEAVRARVSAGFAVGVKLNSADFQKGGFDASDATQVVRWLNDLPVDLVELSGGSYESPAMAGAPADDTSDTSSARREAYFVDFARDVAAIAAMPIMATGGIRRRTVAEEALRPNGHRPGVAMIGIASAFAFEPALAARWARNEATDVAVAKSGWKPPLSSLADMALVKLQLNRVSNGLAPKPHASPLMTLAAGQLRTRQQNKRYRKWITARSVDL